MSATHKVFLVAETSVVQSGMRSALEYIFGDSPNGIVKAHEWMSARVFNQIDGETLVEFMGRLCYKSFEPGLNKNVTKVREGIKPYLENVLKSKHGSVVEHATTTFALLNVSRIFTHELVRHRAGTAYSQESQRFVRLDDFKLYIPDLTESLLELCPSNPTLPQDYDRPENLIPVTPDEWVQNKQDAFIVMADRIKEFTKAEVAGYLTEIGLDAEGVSFHVKKTLTSALRRLLPGGVNTNIGITANHRTWRHLIANRTAFGAEVEIREVFVDIAGQLCERYPNLYQDMQVINNDNGILMDIPQITFLNEKI